jgi:capsular polysaccharide biosynthesis protein
MHRLIRVASCWDMLLLRVRQHIRGLSYRTLPVSVHSWLFDQTASAFSIVSESTLPAYPRPAALRGISVRSGRCELLPQVSRRVSEWSGHRFGKAGRPSPDWWEDDPIVPGRAVELFRLQNAFYFPAGAVISATGDAMEAAVDEIRSSGPGRPLRLLRHMKKTRDGITFDPPPNLPKLERALVTMPGGGVNYGHFVLDCLTGVVATMNIPELQDCPYVFPPLASWQQQHLELLGIKYPTILRRPVYRVSELFYTNTMAHNLHQPNAHFVKLRDFQLRRVGSGVPPGIRDRIYISRRGANSRRFHDEPALERRLDALGFSIIQPEKFEVEQQIEIFHNASVIVGPTGAGFANALYCRPNALVVEIVPTPMAGLWVGWLCALTGARWRPYYCEGHSQRAWAVQHDLQFSVDVDELIRHISALSAD